MTAMTRPSWAGVSGPLAPYAGGFRLELERLGYTPLTAATHVRLMAHLSRWLAREGAEASGLTRRW
jgi:integrase/recombinase XerD